MKHRAIALLVGAGLSCGTMAGAALASGTAAQGAAVHYKVITKYVTVGQNNPSMLVDVKCPTGMHPVGGGAHYGQGDFRGGSVNGVGVSESDIDQSGKGWEVSLYNGYSSGFGFRVDAVCATW